MSIRFSTWSNSPPVVLSAGFVLLAGLPVASSFATSGSATLAILRTANVGGYLANCASVSVPGRIDGQAQGSSSDHDQSSDTTYTSVYSPKAGRSLVTPSGWAFAIWGPIFVGEAVFCASQFASRLVQVTIPTVSAPFVAANLFQSLWCASFRPSYLDGAWEKYVSVGMLGSTAFCLSQVHSVGAASSWYFLPLTMHFGWTTAATLVNLNGSVAGSQMSDKIVIACGLASAVAASCLGVGITIVEQSPAYGLTISWALAACADGMKKRLSKGNAASNEMTKAMILQRNICCTGAIVCAVSSLFAFLSQK